MASERDIRRSLENQLKARGADVAVYNALIGDYLWFNKQLNAMKKDIKERGRTYEATSAQGKKYEKSNPSVKDALIYSKQMVAILSALGLSTVKVIDTDNTSGDGDLG